MNFSWDLSLSILPLLLKASLVTIGVTTISFALSLVGGMIILLVRRSSAIANSILGFVVEFIRNTPLLVQILFLYLALPDYGVVLSAFSTGVLALSIHYSAYISEVYRAGLEAIPRGQWEAARALNYPIAKMYSRIILPQIVPFVIPAAGNFFVYMFKDSPLLAAISLVELVFVAQEIGAQTFNYLEPMTLVGLIFLALGLIASAMVRMVESRVGLKWKRR